VPLVPLISALRASVALTFRLSGVVSVTVNV